MNFWGSEVWGTLNLVAVLLLSMLAATVMKNVIKPLRVSLIPTSVLGGLILLVLSSVYEIITKCSMLAKPYDSFQSLMIYCSRNMK